MNTKNIDDKIQGENKPRFNIADAIIIIIILAVITALALRIYNILGTEEKVINVRVSFKITQVTTETAHMDQDDPLYSTLSNEQIGYIEKFVFEDSVVIAPTASGEQVEITIPGKSDITGTIVLYCTKNNDCFYLNGTKLLTVGEKISLYNSKNEFQFEISEIKEIYNNTNSNN